MVQKIRVLLCSSFFLIATALCAAPSPKLIEAATQASNITELCSTKKTLPEQACLLLNQEAVKTVFLRYPLVQQFLEKASVEQQYVLGLMIALGQSDVLFEGMTSLSDPQASLQKLANQLIEIDTFYQSIGGVLGYHKTVLKLMSEGEAKDSRQFYPPPAQDIRTPDSTVWNACYWGTAQLHSAATILALGGAGDRLNLIDEATGEPLPAACLPFCGRSLFEGLMRDVEAQEYWHYRVFGKQVRVPIVIMTSLEKNNDLHIEAMGKAANWFGHKPSTIRRVIQSLVPVIDTDGQWILSSPLQLALKPGGHGVIWKLAQQAGALQWLSVHGIDAAIVRQVNNPFAGLDLNLLSFFGYGHANNKSFGFLSCPSQPGLAEGMNILAVESNEKKTQAAISNIEYTQFAAYKTQQPQLFANNGCPANTNILYIGLANIPTALKKVPIPGMIVNPKTSVDVMHNGQTTKKTGGRLESCMQNIADGLASPINSSTLPNVSPTLLSTFLMLQERGKVMSTAKKAYVAEQPITETPVGCLHDWHTAMRVLLQDSCHMTLPQARTEKDFPKDGPSFVFSFHPAMGPLWNIIGQKISGGSIAEGSELELEIAELSCKNLSLNGSLRIHANTVTGPISADEGTVFTDHVGRAKLQNLTVQNKGLCDRLPTNILKGTLSRHESCEIILEGFSEIVASNITINGPFRIVVPDGYRATLTQDSSGKISPSLEKIVFPSWHYTVEWKGGLPPTIDEAA